MRRPFTYCASVSAVLILSASTSFSQRSQPHAAPYPRPGVLKLGENDRAVAWEVLRPKGVVSPMYQLPLDQVVTTLTEGAVRFTALDRSTRISQEKFGAVRFESQGTVQQEEGLNGRNTPLRYRSNPGRIAPCRE